MVAGVFVARWTVPMALKGTSYVWLDLKEKPHLIVWAILAGMLWAVANTLTVFAIRNVGLSIAFPVMEHQQPRGIVLGLAAVQGTARLRRARVAEGPGRRGRHRDRRMPARLCDATALRPARRSGRRSAFSAPLGAGMLWGTMYIPYRKAYISGMNPLSFVTVFTFGELGLPSPSRRFSMAA